MALGRCILMNLVKVSVLLKTVLNSQLFYMKSNCLYLLNHKLPVIKHLFWSLLILASPGRFLGDLSSVTSSVTLGGGQQLEQNPSTETQSGGKEAL